MIDSLTHKPLKIIVQENTTPYLTLPLEQLAELKALLEKNDIMHWASPYAISIDSKPATIVVNISRNVDAQKVQEILDSAP